ncbi:MAG: sulfatase-like hydrolase/transferase [Thermoleophilaceae bacterium]|nr:sulfatase-like hydrolase/transferase [Thermoleophilaceae bacterium]
MRARALALLLAAAALLVGGAPRAAETDHPTVVLLILDEFPVDDLVRPDGRIDAARFPNFAKLAATSTWFRSGTTVYDSTTKAVPAILDARAPRRGTPPGVEGHPRNIFTLFDSLGYEVDAAESVSSVCPTTICATSTPPTGVIDRLRGSDRPGRLRRWAASIRNGTRPTLYVHHALLPHEPWIYLPSGRQSRPGGKDPVGAVNRPNGFGDPDLTDHNHLRHLLQVGALDRDLGALLSRLRRTGLFDEALIVVVADHGYSFEVGAPDRRQVTDGNIAQIAPVPYFVKAPGQRDGRVDDRLVRTLDVLPTIAGLVGARIPWPHEGRSAYSVATRRRTVVRIPRRDFSRVISVSHAELASRRAAIRQERARLLGTGAESRLFLGDPWAAAYRIGPHPELIGRAAPARAPRAEVRAALANAHLLRSVPARGGILPTRVTGELRGGSEGELRDLAVAANGRIEAVGRSFRLTDQPQEWFSLMLPETAIRPGRNGVELFEVGDDDRLTSLGRF